MRRSANARERLRQGRSGTRTAPDRLCFTKTGEENLERAYRTTWISPGLVAAKRRRRAARSGVEAGGAGVSSAVDEALGGKLAEPGPYGVDR